MTISASVTAPPAAAAKGDVKGEIDLRKYILTPDPRKDILVFGHTPRGCLTGRSHSILVISIAPLGSPPRVLRTSQPQGAENRIEDMSLRGCDSGKCPAHARAWRWQRKAVSGQCACQLAAQNKYIRRLPTDAQAVRLTGRSHSISLLSISCSLLGSTSRAPFVRLGEQMR